MHTANVQELKELLLKTDEEFRQLATQHHELDDRLHELSGKPYLSDPEQVEEVTLKKAQAAVEGQDGRYPSTPSERCAGRVRRTAARIALRSSGDDRSRRVIPSSVARLLLQ